MQNPLGERMKNAVLCWILFLVESALLINVFFQESPESEEASREKNQSMALIL